MFPPPAPPPAVLPPGWPPPPERHAALFTACLNNQPKRKKANKGQLRLLLGPLLGSYLLRVNSAQCCTTWTDVQNVKADSNIKYKSR